MKRLASTLSLSLSMALSHSTAMATPPSTQSVDSKVRSQPRTQKEPSAAIPSIEVAIEELSEFIDVDDNQEALAWEKLNSRVGAVEELQEYYESMGSGEYVEKWTVLFALGEIDAERGVDFLAEKAIEPIVSTGLTQTRNTSDSEEGPRFSVRAREISNRCAAASSLAERFVKGSGSKTAIDPLISKVLRSAEPEVSLELAVSLYGHSALTDVHKSILESRSIPSEFRILSEEEKKTYFSAAGEVRSARDFDENEKL